MSKKASKKKSSVKKGTKHIQFKKVTDEFDIDLSAKKKETFGDKSDDLQAKVDDKTAELKDLSAKLRAEIKTLDTERKRLVYARRMGYERLTLEVKREFNFKTGKVKSTHVNLGVVENREMTNEEKQMQLALDAEKPKTKTKKAEKANGEDGDNPFQEGGIVNDKPVEDLHI